MNDESALLKAARRLDKHALTKIFNTYAPALYNYALRLCSDPIDADNIVGDVFAKLLEKLVAGQGPMTNLKAYLYQMAYHAIVDAARHDHRLAPLDALIDTPDKLKKASVQAHVEEREVLTAFKDILNNELSEIQRHVIILRFMEDFSLRETAVILDKNVNHVKVIQNRGLAKLRKLLANRFGSTWLQKPLILQRNGD
jgi:RNA polymerase sigma-70 factor (ECF subfamily)